MVKASLDFYLLAQLRDHHTLHYDLLADCLERHNQFTAFLPTLNWKYCARYTFPNLPLPSFLTIWKFFIDSIGGK
jgi:hypothetical protein